MLGIYDSGIGGLSVVNELKTQNKHTDVVYLLDNLHFPYGPRADSELLPIVHQNLETLASQGVDTCIIACHTASALYLRYGDYFANIDMHILDIITPTIRYIHDNKIDNLAIIATSSTCKSGVYQHSLQSLNNLTMCPTPTLAQDVERYFDTNTFDTQGFAKSIQHSNLDNCSTLLLGCTHYDFVIAQLTQYLPSIVTYINPATVIAQQLVISNQSPSFTLLLTHHDMSIQTKVERVRALSV